MRYSDNHDETITDTKTGLMWVKSPDSTTRTWQEALDYANGLTLCGYTDWRLPNVNELKSLVNAEQSDTAAWLNGQGFSNVRSGLYWSSSTSANYPDYAWGIDMWIDVVCLGYKTSGYFVLPVRIRK